MAIVNDILPSSVPKLDVSGGNWVIFLLRFQTIVKGKSLWEHFDGSMPCLVLSSSAQSSTPLASSPTQISRIILTVSITLATLSSSTLVASSPTGTAADIAAWEQDENIAYAFLIQYILDSTLIVILSCATMKLMWDTIIHDYTYKSVFSQAHLCRGFITAQCSDKSNVYTFLNDLCVKKAELLAVGIHINDDNYRSTII